MAPRGRPPKPTQTKKLEGNPGKRPLSEAEPKAAGRPMRPESLTGDAAWLWDQVVEELGSSGVAKQIDTAMLWSLCEMWGFYRRAAKAAEEHPFDKDVRIAVTGYWSAFERAASKFGLDPATRSRLRTGNEDKPEDPLARFGIVG